MARPTEARTITKIAVIVTRRIAAALPLLCLVLSTSLLSSCGHDTMPYVDGTVSPSESGAVLTTPEDLIRGESYAGHLVVHFDEDLVVRQDASKAVYSGAGRESDLAPVQATLSRFSSTATLLRSVDLPEEEVDAQREDLERLSGERLADWNSIYHIETSDPEEAVALMNELAAAPGVEAVYPAVIPSPSGIGNTPDLSGLQGYLFPEMTHGGLNANAAHAQGIKGDGVIMVASEFGINFDHEDLGLVAKEAHNGGNAGWLPPVCAHGFIPQMPNCPSHIAHGTAVAGVMVGMDNAHGVKGMAPGARYISEQILTSTFGDLASATDGRDEAWTHADDNIDPGSIWVIEVQLPGPRSNGSCGGGGGDIESQRGCIPIEAWPESFAASKQATAYGVTVVIGAGNGQENLDDLTPYTGNWSFARTYLSSDAGSIMVGASQGSNKQIAVFSNYGSRLNAFGWGQGVVTTSYPTASAWTQWSGNPPPGLNNNPNDPNNYYTNNFGGTSSAAAMVGGAAALVQSKARKDLGYKRYIMPPKMRDILVQSGVAKAGGGGNIGKQPRVDIALNLLASFLTQAKQSYPQLVSGQRLDSPTMLSMRQLGVGIVCKKFDPVASDPICPEAEIYPPGSGIARTLDFDGDKRADLVQWTNGKWKLDLSGRGEGGDNFGKWDVEINHAAIPGKWVWPYAADMNSDGRTDLVVYDKEHGTFYIALTDLPMLKDGKWHDWDKVVDYSAWWKDDLKLDPKQSNYSRPVLSDYNNDKWMDLAIACSDGYWRIDFGGPGMTPFGKFDVNAKYLTIAQLAAAPGWAYTVAPEGLGDSALAFRVPDGLPEEGRLLMVAYDNPSFDQLKDIGVQHVFGGNDDILLMGMIRGYGSSAVITLKDSFGDWIGSDFNGFTYPPPTMLPPKGVWGGNECHPAIADYDGDSYEDRATMCPNEWRISYSDRQQQYKGLLAPDGLRHISLSYDTSAFSLPGRSYSGGITYSYAQQLIQFYQQANPGVPPPIPVDMVTFQ